MSDRYYRIIEADSDRQSPPYYVPLKMLMVQYQQFLWYLPYGSIRPTICHVWGDDDRPLYTFLIERKGDA